MTYEPDWLQDERHSAAEYHGLGLMDPVMPGIVVQDMTECPTCGSDDIVIHEGETLLEQDVIECYECGDHTQVVVEGDGDA